MESISVSTKQLLERLEKLRTSLVTLGESDGRLQKTLANYECQQCKDELGYLVRDDQGNEKWRICDCVEGRRQKRLFKSSNISGEFQRVTFDNFVLDGRPECVRSAYYAVQHYLANFESLRGTKNNSIALLGVPGSGKTHLLIAAANTLLAQGIGVLYFPWVEGSNELRDAVAKKADVQAKIDAMKNVDVLFIDDLFKGRKEVKDFQLEWLFEVVNYRYLNHLQMMVSSERYFDQIFSIDEGIGRRIFERSRAHKVDMQLGQDEKGVLNYSIRETK